MAPKDRERYDNGPRKASCQARSGFDLQPRRKNSELAGIQPLQHLGRWNTAQAAGTSPARASRLNIESTARSAVAALATCPSKLTLAMRQFGAAQRIMDKLRPPQAAVCFIHVLGTDQSKLARPEPTQRLGNGREQRHQVDHAIGSGPDQHDPE